MTTIKLTNISEVCRCARHPDVGAHDQVGFLLSSHRKNPSTMVTAALRCQARKVRHPDPCQEWVGLIPEVLRNKSSAWDEHRVGTHDALAELLHIGMKSLEAIQQLILV